MRLHHQTPMATPWLFNGGFTERPAPTHTTSRLPIPTKTRHRSRPRDSAGEEIHIILEVLDMNQEIGMYDYRRVVLEVIDTETV